MLSCSGSSKPVADADARRWRWNTAQEAKWGVEAPTRTLLLLSALFLALTMVVTLHASLAPQVNRFAPAAAAAASKACGTAAEAACIRAWTQAAVDQDAFCRRVMDAAGKQVAVRPPNSTIHQYKTGDSTTVRMFTLASSDYVSTNIQHGYERNLTAAILQLLRDAAAAADADRPPLYVDLGANLGLHAVPVAAAGFNVLAFEAAPTNLALLRTTLCANQPLLSNVSLLATALGREAQNCSMHAWAGNKGNGYLFCDGRPVPEGYVHLGDASTRRLDDLLHTQVEVLKMDVEGFESHVFAGATKLLSQGLVQWIAFEYTPWAVAQQGGDPLSLLVALLACGYECSLQSMDTAGHPSTWSYLKPAQLLELGQHVAEQHFQVNLLCRKRRRLLDFLTK